jgi:hypothetical protein
MFAGTRKVSLTADGWSSPYGVDFLGVTAHWIDDNWVQREMVIGFEPLNGSHTAENMLEALLSVLYRFHLGEKLLAITTDKASNMLRMVRLLGNHAQSVSW